MLSLRPNCELCDTDLAPSSADARICTYECTFCASCVEEVLHDVCPNCGGNFAPRPIRPVTAWRPGTGLGQHPPDAQRRTVSFSRDEIEALSVRLRAVPAGER